MEINKREQVALLRQDWSVIYHFAPPVMQLYYKNPLHKFFSFRFTTYTRTAGFCLKDKLNFGPWCAKIRLFCVLLKVLVPPSNNPFEPPTESKRYNTLDFTQ